VVTEDADEDEIIDLRLLPVLDRKRVHPLYQHLLSPLWNQYHNHPILLLAYVNRTVNGKPVWIPSTLSSPLESLNGSQSQVGSSKRSWKSNRNSLIRKPNIGRV
jgi:glutathionylspermidine synthase